MVLGSSPAYEATIAFIGYFIGLVGAIVVARKKNLGKGARALGLLGVPGFIIVALLPAKCRGCQMPLIKEEVRAGYCKDGVCPRCQGPSGTGE